MRFTQGFHLRTFNLHATSVVILQWSKKTRTSMYSCYCICFTKNVCKFHQRNYSAVHELWLLFQYFRAAGEASPQIANDNTFYDKTPPCNGTPNIFTFPPQVLSECSFVWKNIFFPRLPFATPERFSSILFIDDLIKITRRKLTFAIVGQCTYFSFDSFVYGVALGAIPLKHYILLFKRIVSFVGRLFTKTNNDGLSAERNTHSQRQWR